jgi:hypothetical protein
MSAAKPEPGSVSQTLTSALRLRKTPLTVKEFAEAGGISIKTVYTGTKSGLIPHRRICGCIRFDPHTTADWLESLDIP